MIPVLVVAAAYLIGSISFAVVVSRLYGLPDPHSYGSGNPGATNVLRTGNKVAAAATLAGDAVKGWLAVWLAGLALAGRADADIAVAAVALAVFVGHVYPVFHGFAGGKGVATAGGVLVALSPWLGLAVVAAWLLVAAVFRVSSLAALAAAIVAPVLAWAVLGNRPQAWVVVPISLLLIWRHRSNIEKLLGGRESRIGR